MIGSMKWILPGGSKSGPLKERGFILLARFNNLFEPVQIVIHKLYLSPPTEIATMLWILISRYLSAN